MYSISEKHGTLYDAFQPALLDHLNPKSKDTGLRAQNRLANLRQTESVTGHLERLYDLPVELVNVSEAEEFDWCVRD